MTTLREISIDFLKDKLMIHALQIEIFRISSMPCLVVPKGIGSIQSIKADFLN